MTVAAKDDELRRLADKSLGGQLLWELQNGFELSPRESQGVLETVKLLYSERPETQTGKVSLWVVKRDASVGKPLDELEKIQVWVTLHAGQEDLETYEAFGHAGLRRQKILRITEEILDLVYTEICRKTQHSAKAVKRYVNTFGRVVALYERGIKEPVAIAQYAGISERLAAEYVELYRSG